MPLKRHAASALGTGGVLFFVGLWLRDWGAWLPQLPHADDLVAVDFNLYLEATRRFLAGGPFYEPWQLAGHYDALRMPILYPPETIVLFAPFTVLPAFLWWAIPIAIVGATIIRLRPRPAVWPLIALCLWWPFTTTKLLSGNPDLWCTAFVALGTVWRWPAALGLFKFSLAPFCLVGVRDPRWWLVATVAGLPFAWLLPQYAVALSNFDAPGGLLYSLIEIPMLAIPVIAWAGRQRPPRLAKADEVTSCHALTAAWNGRRSQSAANDLLRVRVASSGPACRSRSRSSRTAPGP